jgi:hypothetical protein
MIKASPAEGDGFRGEGGNSLLSPRAPRRGLSSSPHLYHMYGATFDFIAARAARYPVIMRRSQLHKAIRKALHPGKQKIQAVGGYS